MLDQYSSFWLKAGMARQKQQITVALLQTMLGRYQEYTSDYSDPVDRPRIPLLDLWRLADGPRPLDNCLRWF